MAAIIPEAAAARRHTVQRRRWEPEPVKVKSRISSEGSNVQNDNRDDVPVDVDEGACCNTTFKVVKVIVYILMLCLVFILSMLSTSTVLLATSNLGLNQNKTVDQCDVSAIRELEGRRGYCSRYNMLWAWSLFLIICVPYAFVFVRCLWNVMFKRRCREMPTATVFVVSMVLETLSAVGLALMAFMLLPHLNNAVQGTLVLCGMVGIPSVMSVIFSISLPTDVNPGEARHSSPRPTPNYIGPNVEEGQSVNVVDQPTTEERQEEDGDEEEEVECCSALWTLVDKFSHIISGFFERKCPLTITNIAACVIQVVSVYVALVFAVGEGETPVDVRCVAVSLICFSLFVSTRWWENYIGTEKGFNFSKLRTFREKLVQLHGETRKSRHTTHLFASVWKIVVTLVVMVISVEASYTGGAKDLFELSTSECSVEERFHDMDWVYVWLINCCSSLACYFLVRSAAKMQMRRLGFVVPLVLSFPAMLFFMIGSCSEVCGASKTSTFMPKNVQHLYFKCHNYSAESMPVFYVFGSLWILSFLWITRHTWLTTTYRLAPTAKIFLLPLYDAVLLPQSLLLNTRLSYLDTVVPEPPDAAPACEAPPVQAERPMNRHAHDFPTIYACATMWHEDLSEMKALLQSLFRMDNDQAAKENAQELFNFTHPGYFKFEAHIFFDDAIVESKGKNGFVVNDFVCSLNDAVKQAAKEFYRADLNMGFPTRYETPYGGRLTWILPGGTDLVVHLKNSSKIRQRKRWSQVMYMYYLLGYKLLNCSKEERRELLKNRYILALDGDVDFEPEAVFKLVDLMKRSDDIGAVCGRIHPVGSGPMVWYQQFEYALGHWLQKATEHVIGCVLCSPGCFSLFRGSALFGTILDKYSKVPNKAQHYIMYDQGEDRWLCTLLLQNGYRVEYCASSDSLTNSPTTLQGFFKQRRRWIPSTIANVIGLLGSWEHTVAINDNISFIYIAYQFLLLAVSLFGPGMIFMMLCGALPVAFSPSTTNNGTVITSAEGAFPIWASVLINAIPVVAFTIACFIASSDFQLKMAELLTAVYVLLQLIVLVSICVQMARTAHLVPIYCDPTAVYMLFVVAVFLLCGLCHPGEFTCLLHGFIYYLAIPSMYMLLMIYSICNLHDMSWGTREGSLTAAENTASRLQKRTKEIFSNLFPGQKNKNKSGDPEALLPHEQPADERDTPNETAAEPANVAPPRPWIEDKRLGDVACIEQLPDDEIEFFAELIDVRLKPVEKEQEKKERAEAQEELIKLRNSVASFFLFGNVVFIVMISLLQYHVEDIGIPWVKIGCKHPNFPEAKVDPLGFLFMVVCGGMMLIQACGMLVHRAGTFIHVMSTTLLGCLTRYRKSKSVLSDRYNNYVKKCLELQRLDSVENLENVAEADGEGGRKSVARNVCMANAMRLSASIQRRLSGPNGNSRVSRVDKELYRRISQVQQRYSQSGAVSLSGVVPVEMPRSMSPAVPRGSALSMVAEESEENVSNVSRTKNVSVHSQDNHINMLNLRRLAESRLSSSSSSQTVSGEDNMQSDGAAAWNSEAGVAVSLGRPSVDNGSRINEAHELVAAANTADTVETFEWSGNMMDEVVTVQSVDNGSVRRVSGGRNSMVSRSSSAASTNSRRQVCGSINSAYEQQGEGLSVGVAGDIGAVGTDNEDVAQHVDEQSKAKSKRRSAAAQSNSGRQSQACGSINAAYEPDEDPSDVSAVGSDNEEFVSKPANAAPKRRSELQSTSNAMNNATGNSIDVERRSTRRPSSPRDSRSAIDASVEGFEMIPLRAPDADIEARSETETVLIPDVDNSLQLTIHEDPEVDREF